MTCSNSQYYLSLFLLLLPSLFFTLSSSHSITLPFSAPKTPNHHLSAATKTLWQQLRHMAIARSSNISSTTPLSAFPVGTISLAFGTPQKNLLFALSGSASITSIPCGANFSCRDGCKDILTFKPELSNSSALVYCNDTLLQEIVSRDLVPVCFQECTAANDSCVAEYIDDEGSLSMSGVILSESLTLPGVKGQANNLLVGCASESDGWPQGMGIAAFRRVPSSLVSQLNVTKFSHCFVSKIYEGDRNVSDKILVGGIEVDVPTEYLKPDEDGNGGMKVEVGYTVSVMDERVFKPFVQEFEKQVGTMGGELVVPVENYIGYWNDSVICMMIWSNDSETTRDDYELGRPAIVLGQWQMQNVYVEYDLANNRHGLQPRNCSQGS
ncbi:Unknown protein [Striga hermonthica]|uniref:Peptidase A1 domain-containing protein n=1 Tax=Striga hermonthica TaxID=68872 RepID=A0A9N7NF35_STRHE|nr:Unknown protein [Striga hermonthica]